MNPPGEEWDDPFERHFRRAPLPAAGVSVVVIAECHAAGADAIAQGLLDLIRAQGRDAEALVVDPGEGWNRALIRGLEAATLPLVLVSWTSRVWSGEHLAPMLKAIDHCDHVVGRRRIAWPLRVLRRWKSIAWRVVFAVPVSDPHSPCQLHRREPLAAIPVQSASSFLPMEILAKATFLGHLIDEVAIPALPALSALGYWGDLLDVFRHPTFRHSQPQAAAAELGDDSL